MKKLFLSMLALAGMVACNNDVIVDVTDSRVISFDGMFVENKTRAAVDPSFNNDSNTLKAFDVWGYMDETTGTVFDAERVEYVGDKWTYDPLQYWMTDREHNYYFYAVAPVDNTDITVNKQLNDKGLGTIDFKNTDGTVDLLYAEKHVHVNTDGDVDVIKLQFAHLLSKIKFTFQNAFPEGGYNTLKVENITIAEAPSEGTVILNADARSWEIKGNGTTLNFGNVNGGVALNPTEKGESDVERLTIPAADNVRYKIDFDMTLYQGSEVGMKSHKTLYLEGQDFVMGKNYNFIVVVNPNNFAENALEEIKFDVVVEDWVEADFNGNFVEDNNTQNPGQPGVVTPGEASDWALVGAFSSWADKTMLTTANADVVVLEDVALKAAEGFLVRKPATEWADKYGASNVNYIKANHYITTSKSGADMCVEADGTYDVYFNTATKNLYVMEADANYADADEQKVSGEEPKQEEPEVTEKVVYLKPNSNWKTDGARFAAYFFGGSVGEKWVSMTAVEEGIYKVNLPEGYDYGCSVIFCRMNPNTAANNWSNKWNQTGDLKVPTDGKNLFTLAASAWDGATTTWSVYTPAVAEPVALATPKVTAEVAVNVITLTWEAIEGASHYTVQVDDDVEEEVNATSYTFEGDYEFEYTFTVKAIAADTTKNLNSEAAVVTATTEAKPQGPVAGDEITVAQFLELKDTTNEFVLTGKITRVVNTSYGNFDLTDATGTVYVYGLLTPDGAQQKQWAAAGLREGDTITIKGKYDVYNNEPQVKNATYISHVAAPFIEATAVTVEAAETAATLTVSANVAWTVACDAAWVTSYTTSGSENGSIYVEMEANESEEDRVATFTLSADDVADVVVKLTQKGVPAEGEVVGGSDDFNTITSTNTSYVSGKTTAGWNYKNCAILKGGTSDSNPAFKMFGDASNRALCMNGKTSAVGSITSPTLTTGCGTLTFNYGLPFSDTKIKFRVDIIQNGETVHTFTINNASATKSTVYSHEEVVNVAGEFQIVFTNLSPSNNTGNKDRTAIWNVEWTGCN